MTVPTSLPPILLSAPVAVYGAGTVARDTISALRAHGVEVSHVFDHATPEGAAVGTLPVLPASSNEFHAMAADGAAIVIAIFNPHADVSAIRTRCRDAGWQFVYTFVELYEALYEELGERFWLGQRRILDDAQDEIVRVRALWSDDESRRIYDSILKFRRHGDYGLHPTPTLDDQYVPRLLPRWPEPLRLVDGGAFDGDTIRQLRGGGYEVEAVMAFEPDEDNAERLEGYLATAPLPEAVVHRVGLWNCEMTLDFLSAGSSSSLTVNGGSYRVQCAALDDMLNGFEPNVVKLDIEGAELPALAGARRCLEKLRPCMAVCVYHRPQDLWQIPIYLHDALGPCDFFLRIHARSGFELVVYAFPR